MPRWTDDQREEVVRRVERHARLSPRDFRARVIYFVLIGYAYILAVFLFVLMLGAQAWLRLTTGAAAQSLVLGVGLLFVVLALVAIVHVLWVRTPRAEGQPITRADTPALFALLDRLHAAIRGPHVHRVLVTAEFEAAMAQWPRLGWLGWHENTLVLGLPLLCALTPGELEAVLAHELGHLAGRHGRLAGWIGRMARTWERVTTKLEERRYFAAGVFTRFLRWYGPWFEVYVAVLRRMQERVADAAAVSVAGPRGMAEALMNSHLREMLLVRRLWPAVHDGARASAEPRVAPFRGFIDGLRVALPTELASAWLDEVLAERTELDAAHPALPERLAMLGIAAEAAAALARLEAVPESAAERLLGTALPALAERLDARWRARVADAWRERYETAQAMRAELASLEHAVDALTPDAAYRRAELVDELHGAEAALALLRGVLAMAPDHNAAALRLGQLLVERDDADGVPLLERAALQNPRVGASAYAALQRFALRRRDTRAALGYESRAAQAARRLERDETERRELWERDSLATPTLSSESDQRLRAALARHDSVREAYVVRKELSVYPDRPLHLVVFRGNAQDEERLTTALDDTPDTDVVVYALDELPRSLQARLLAIAGEPFYRPAVAR